MHTLPDENAACLILIDKKLVTFLFNNLTRKTDLLLMKIIYILGGTLVNNHKYYTGMTDFGKTGQPGKTLIDGALSKIECQLPQNDAYDDRDPNGQR